MISIKEAEEILKKEYVRDNYYFILDELLLPDFKHDEHNVPFSGSCFKNVLFCGYSNKCDLSVFEVILTDEYINKRVYITQEMFKILRKLNINNAIVSFANPDNNNYRISLLTSKYEIANGKIVKILSNPRRFSYSLGYGTKTKTAYKFLIEKGKVDNLDDLIKRFSVEIVNKQFYAQISTSFTELVGGERNGKKYNKLLFLKNVKNHKKYSEFGVRLIGRIMFCWFLKEKKSASGISLIDDSFFNNLDKNESYYHEKLEILFFELLNTPVNRRKSAFRKKNYDLIPYLNGGLFSPHFDDLYSFDKTSNCGKKNDIYIPNEWFINFYRILNEYNFTVDENTSYDIELSIDPEMLGRIFENLLAEINPETGENAKKSTGSFYTPREIVDYMVDNSLIECLYSKTGIDVKKLNSLIKYSKFEDDLGTCFDKKEKEKLINAIYTITVFDPACGSGAFPIGMLQKLVYILQEIDPNAEMWLKKATTNVDPVLKSEIEKKFSSGSLNYIRKLSVIQNSIFGVDIQPIAVEISRLRCFLSLIIEEKVYDDICNRGINPLPNLDFKFVIANSLIKLDDDKQTSLFENQDHIDELKGVRDEYFNANSERRNELKLQIANIQQEMLLNTINNYNKIASLKYKQLYSWKPFANEATEWFDPDWMFGINNGFDIVIGNPPYLDSENMVNSGLSNEREYICKNYDFAKGNWDIYIAFFEKGFKLLSQNGCEMFITPDKWISRPFGDELRKNLIKNIKSILFAGRDVFESALVDSIITTIKREKTNYIDVFVAKTSAFCFERSVDKNVFSAPYPLDLLNSPYVDLVLKIKEGTKSLSTIALCENACATSDCYKLKDYIVSLSSPDKYNDNYLKIVNTGTIGRYVSKWNVSEMKYLKDKYSFPVVLKQSFLDNFTNSYGSKSLKKKLIIKGLTKLDCCLDLNGEIIPGKSTMIISTSNENLFLLSAIINSKIMMFYIEQKYASSSYNGGINFTKDMINSLPIKTMTADLRNRLINLSKSIYKGKMNNPLADFTEIENEIDCEMYKLYELNEHEIKIVEDNVNK